MKKLLIPLLVFIMIFVGCENKSSENYISDNIQNINENILSEIFKTYHLSSVTNINYQDTIPFKEAFSYIYYAGIYNINENNSDKFSKFYNEDLSVYSIPTDIVDSMIANDEIYENIFNNISPEDDTYVLPRVYFDIRPEIYQYLNQETWIAEVPSELIDTYILSKFKTSIDHTDISIYNKANDTYLIEPFRGGIVEDLSVIDIKIEDSLVSFTGVIELEGDIKQVEIELEFIDGEYRFLKVTSLKPYASNKNIPLTSEIISDFTNYYFNRKQNKDGSIEVLNNNRVLALELQNLPNFQNVDDINHDDLIRYAYESSLISEYNRNDEGYILLSKKAVENTINKLFGRLPKDFKHRDTRNFTVDDKNYIPNGFDSYATSFMRIKKLSVENNIYTAIFDVFEINETDYYTEYTQEEYKYYSDTMKRVVDYILVNKNDKNLLSPSERLDVLLEEILISKDYDQILQKSYEITVMFKYTKDKDFPIQYVSKDTQN